MTIAKNSIELKEMDSALVHSGTIMFVEQLTQEDKKSFFLSLAVLVMMVSGEVENLGGTLTESNLQDIEEIKNKLSFQDVFLKQLLNNIQQEELYMLKAYMRKLDLQDWLEPYRGRNGRTHLRIMRDSKDSLIEILQKYSFNAMSETTASDRNSPYKLQSDIGLYILKNVSSDIIQQKNIELSRKESKMILTELISIGFNRGSFDDEEKALVRFIGRELGLDDESFDEIAEIIEKIFFANRELTELINE